MSATAASSRGDGVQSCGQFLGGDELDVFLDEIETGFELGEQRERVRRGVGAAAGPGCRPVGSMAVCKFVGAVGVDHAEHRFGLRQIESAGEKGAEREFARLGEARAGAADGVEHGAQAAAASRACETRRPARACSCGRSARGRGRREGTWWRAVERYFDELPVNAPAATKSESSASIVGAKQRADDRLRWRGR